MVVAREGLTNDEESAYGGHQLAHRLIAMVARDSVVQRFPYSLDTIDPRMVCGLKEQAELRVVPQPTPGDVALVGPVVVHDEHDAPGAAVGALERVEQMDKQQRRDTSATLSPVSQSWSTKARLAWSLVA